MAGSAGISGSFASRSFAVKKFSPVFFIHVSHTGPAGIAAVNGSQVPEQILHDEFSRFDKGKTAFEKRAMEGDGLSGNLRSLPDKEAYVGTADTGVG